jgi:hypothetical protein
VIEKENRMSNDEAEQRIIDGSAWHAFCDALKKAGDGVLRSENPGDAFNRAEGYRYLTRLLRAGLEAQVEFGDPRFPGFYQLSNETIKIGNDNPDNRYLNSTVSGRYDYRITGSRGSVPYLSIGTKAGGYETSGTMVPTGHIDAKDMKIEADGQIEIIVSCKEQPGNWLPMKPETTQLIVRQTFGDREHEKPASLRIECLNADGGDALDPLALESKLAATTRFVENTSGIFIDWMQRYAKHINQLPSDDQAICQNAGGDASIHYFQSFWRLADDEALVIRPERIPVCAAWNFQLSNYWMESLDYRRHKIWINNHTAVYDDEDNVTIVVAHEDPGPAYPNWLETAGHHEGGMLFRWIDAKDHPPVNTRVVKLGDL